MTSTIPVFFLPIILMGAAAPAGCEAEVPSFSATANDSGDTALDTSGEVTEDHSVNCQPWMAVSFRECEATEITFGLVGGAQVIDAREIQEDGSSVAGSPTITYTNPEDEDSPSELWMQCSTGKAVRLTILSCRG